MNTLITDHIVNTFMTILDVIYHTYLVHLHAMIKLELFILFIYLFIPFIYFLTKLKIHNKHGRLGRFMSISYNGQDPSNSRDRVVACWQV